MKKSYILACTLAALVFSGAANAQLSTTSFSAGKSVAVSNAPTRIRVADGNGDGKMDIATNNNEQTNDRVHMLLNSGPFMFTDTYATGVGADMGDLTFNDFDGDNNADVLVATGKMFSLFKSNGTSLGTPIDSVFETGTLQDGITGVVVNATMGDVDGDGLNDILAVQEYVSSTGPVIAPCTGAQQGRVWVYLNDGAGGMKKGVVSTCVWTGGVLDIHLADMNNDGKLDVILSEDFADNFWIMKNTSTKGKPSFENAGATGNFVNINKGRNFTNVAFADLNGDNFPEIIVSGYKDSDLLYVAQNKSTKTAFSFGDPVANAFLTGVEPAGVAVADLDGDGKKDVVVVNSKEGSITLFKNNSTSTAFVLDAVGTLSDGLSLGAMDVALADFDGNSSIDIAVTDKVSSSVVIYSSDIVQGVESALVSTDVTVSPNPASEVINVSINSASFQASTAVLYNSLGVAVADSKLAANGGSINVSSLPAGVYTLAIANTSVRKKVTIK